MDMSRNIRQIWRSLFGCIVLDLQTLPYLVSCENYVVDFPTVVRTAPILWNVLLSFGGGLIVIDEGWSLQYKMKE